MNPEIDKIIKEMEGRCPKDNELQTPHTIENYLSVKMARLLFLLAEETEKQNNVLAHFTKWLTWLTAALFIMTGLQVYLMIFKP